MILELEHHLLYPIRSTQAIQLTTQTKSHLVECELHLAPISMKN